MTFSDINKSVEKIVQPIERPDKKLWNEIDSLPKRMQFNSNASEVVDYSRPTGWRAGMRDTVWDNAKDAHGRVRDPLTGRLMSKDQPWDMGHKPGYEFYKHQESAIQRGIDRKAFLDEYYNPNHYRPELPSSNRSHRAEDVTSRYFGD